VNKLLFCALMVLATAAMAQQPAAKTEDLEPGVNTSAPSQSPAPAPAPAAAPAPSSKPQTAAGASQAAANKPGSKPTAKSNAKDRLDLDSTQITGNRELPKVLYIVPWRSAELGDLVGRPVNSLLDEVLEPVDRDVFRRQNRYFEALQPNSATPAPKPEK
jgi:hypothetical protein